MSKSAWPWLTLLGVVGLGLGVAIALNRLLHQGEFQVCRFGRNVPDVRLKGGDLLLCSNHNLFMQSFGRCPWNHVALVYRCPRTQGLFVWEAQVPQVPWLVGITANHNFRGTRLVPLDHFLHRTKGTIAYRSLSRDVDAQAFQRTIYRMWDTAFDTDFLIKGGNRFSGWLVDVPTAQHKLAGAYCACLAAQTLEHLQVLNFQTSSRTVEQVVPADFNEFTECLPWTPNSWYGPNVLIRRPPKAQRKRAKLEAWSQEDLQAAARRLRVRRYPPRWATGRE